MQSRPNAPKDPQNFKSGSIGYIYDLNKDRTEMRHGLETVRHARE